MMRAKRRLVWLAPVVLNLGVAEAALAQTTAAPQGVGATAAARADQAATGQTITGVKVEGNVRADAATVESYLTLHTGDVYDPVKVDQSLKALYATNLFSDVQIAPQGSVLLVTVKENPLVNRVVLEGNSALSDDTLNKELQIKPRSTLTRAKVQADVQRLIELYRRNGRFAATIEPKIVELPQNRVDLVFEIKEGKVTRVASINFVGNKSFSDGDLRDVIATRESAWYRFWSSSDNYDPDRLNYDQELLRRYYLNAGYYDFRILSAVADLTPERDAFIITFTIDEGPIYKIGNVSVESHIPDLKPEELQEKLLTAAGDVYSAEKIQSTVDALTDAAGNLGYAFVNIEPIQRKNADARTVDLVYQINEAPRVYVERINVVGNLRTRDEVIRREFRLSEGDAFNTAKKERTQQRLEALDYFNKVEITQEPGSAPDRTVMNVKVEEKSTGSLQVSAGYGTSEGVLGEVTVTERNFLGKGQTVSIGGAVSEKRLQAQFSFTEPYFLGRNLAAGFDIFDTRYNYQDYSDYDLNRVGGTLRLGFSLTEYLKMSLRYSLHADRVYHVDDDASAAVRQSKGSHLTSSVGYTLSYDRRDNPNKPRSGYVLVFGQEVAGLGGDIRYLKTTASAVYYVPVTDDITFQVGGEAGNIVGLGQNVLIINNFDVGGDNLRGFKDQGVGPRDRDGNDALGGKTYGTGTVEFTFPVGLPNEYGIRGGVFTDFGTLTGLDDKPSSAVDDAALRVSSGAAVYWDSPFGPINLSLAKPVVKKSYDKEQLFRFSFGTNF